ncbi:protein of unknown function [Candidatus Promineifilum breve]|uniref:Uncharacterized protein n=1 Tax=Candidatus Promineifilum breve TaxID=1806508 RepID=A0A160T876_9CHLR|nr:protein of unknown function [Candidatus Promineifilum breve]
MCYNSLVLRENIHPKSGDRGFQISNTDTEITEESQRPQRPQREDSRTLCESL